MVEVINMSTADGENDLVEKQRREKEIEDMAEFYYTEDKL